MWSGRVRVTRVARLASQLPHGSRIWSALGDDRAWTNAEHLAATTVDALNWANYQRGEGKGKKPQPVPRPADIKERSDKAAKGERLALEAARRRRARK